MADVKNFEFKMGDSMSKARKIFSAVGLRWNQRKLVLPAN